MFRPYLCSGTCDSARAALQWAKCSFDLADRFLKARVSGEENHIPRTSASSCGVCGGKGIGDVSADGKERGARGFL
jgi:hypothetical protein